MSKKKVDITFNVTDEGSAAVSKELLAQLNAIRTAALDANAKLNDLGAAQKNAINDAKKRVELEGKLLTGAGSLATTSTTLVSNIAKPKSEAMRGSAHRKARRRQEGSNDALVLMDFGDCRFDE